jgi:predicted transcriptional regulator
MAARTKKGRRTTGHDAVATIRLSSELRESVDAWAAKQSDKPARPEAILRLVELGLETTHRRDSAPNRAAKASEMAAQEIGVVACRRTIEVARVRITEAVTRSAQRALGHGAGK